MGSSLPFLTEARFRQRLLLVSPHCSDQVLASLYLHYSELRRWNKRLSLVGPGTADEVVERHYGESLAALPLIQPSDRYLIDIGTGAGFPGLVLAVAIPALRVTLVEPRERKWAFLCTAIRRCGLSIQCLNVRVERPLPRELPSEIDVVTCRAVSLSRGLLEALFQHSPRVRLLLWCGARIPELHDSYRVEQAIDMAGSRRRRVLEIQLAET